MIIGKVNYDVVKQRQKSSGELSPKHVPLSSEFMSSKNNINERPLKSISNELSFKGLSFSGAEQKSPAANKEDKMKPLLYTVGALAAIGLGLRFAPSYKKAGEYSVNEFLQFSRKYMGFNKTTPKGIKETSIGQDLYEHIRDSKLTNKMVEIEGDKITFHKKTIPQLIWDGLIYPFKILPADILNGTVELIGKIKPFKGWAARTRELPLFKGIRQRSKIDAEVNSLRGLFETAKNLKGKSEKEISSTCASISLYPFSCTKVKNSRASSGSIS